MNLKMKSKTNSYCEEISDVQDLSLVLVTTRAVIDTMDDIRNIIDATITRATLLTQIHRGFERLGSCYWML